jgi:hypothetical protein
MAMNDDLTRRIHILAQWLYEAHYPVFFTGAGISTESGLPPLDPHAHLRCYEGIGQVLPRAVKRLKRLMGLFE